MHRIGTFILLITATALTSLAQPSAPDRDLVIRNGLICDGTGAPLFRGDVAISDGRISAVGSISERGGQELDATGLVVTPGFIDVHTHAEEVTELIDAENFVRMGVTTLVLGNCGSSVLDVAELFRKVTALPPSANVATLAGHGSIRAKAMGGSFDRAPSPEELDAMRSMVRQAMADGALGLSTGLIYLPGVFAKTDEIVELAKVVAEAGGIYASHMRDEGVEIRAALNELFAIAREAGLPAHVSHIKLSGRAAWNQADEILALIDHARQEGLVLTQDQYAYTASSTGISQLVPESARAGGATQFKARLEDPDAKAAIVAEMKAKLERRGEADYEYAAIASYRSNPALNGKRIPEAARLLRGSASLDDQIETILQIQLNGGASGVFHGIQEEDLQVFMRDRRTMVAADSGIRRFNEGVPHPRGYGNNARILARYVRDLELLSLEEAVRRMTSLPAEVFKIRERGRIAAGAYADLVLLNPGEVQDKATFAQPHQYAEGIVHVFVNGVAVVRDGAHTGEHPGRPVQRQD